MCAPEVSAITSRRLSRRCSICTHAKRVEVELALVSGAGRRAIAKKFDVSADAVWRHQRHHLPPERRANLIGGPMKLAELAEKARSENLSLIDYLALVRSTLVMRFLAAADSSDNGGTALLGGRLVEVLRLIAQVTGDLTRATSNVTNNTLILQSPIMADLERVLIERLRPFPDAMRSVFEGLEELRASNLGAPAIEHRPDTSLEVSA